jgi:hypothetical protein
LWAFFFIQGERNDVDHIFWVFRFGDIILPLDSEVDWDGETLPKSKTFHTHPCLVLMKQMTFRAQLNGVKAIDNLSCIFRSQIFSFLWLWIGCEKNAINDTPSRQELLNCCESFLLPLLNTKKINFKSNEKGKNQKYIKSNILSHQRS